jgi:ribosomal protein S18 acetylase RimI-like enzyme
MALIHRIAKPNELDIAFTLLKEAALWLKEKHIDYWQNWIDPPQYYREWIYDGFQHNEFRFVYDNDDLVGMYRLQFNDEKFWGKREDKAGYIHSFTTKREYYSKGIGHKILDEIEIKLKAEKIKYLRLDCGSKNKELCSYYEHYGFLRVGEIELDGTKQSLYEKRI